MEALTDRKVVEQITTHYQALSTLVPLHPLNDEADYERAVGILNGLLDAGAADENHPLATLVETLGMLISHYDDQHYPAPPVSPAAVIRSLMEQHELTQRDLAEIGSQGVVSEVLSGKRELNIRQVKALARRFDLPVGLFIT
ncbi:MULTISPECIES: type II toxin-antitoxin system HigA family antitoxin [unclassified Janthinobacterium]|uniref:helix-turn-helix domain-containing protein n=1 Tax=unclassified Janthinobacterium TaxID=2610881 RepID=UPI00160B95AA|nr:MULTISPECIES: helix-turn-helix domain-containing protein [unclassified Janthinobacterium]MBB5606769.1 HTH-type transcriptional regulator/antitoxin HigA [Janthinobacterium sp. S3T4]MBB5612181.1 HTH-type transcriptional regulator/antitoxin HigA [Janthinobacterium sp. S3M3]